MRPLRGAHNFTIDQSQAICTSCGTPIDAQYFDVSRVVASPRAGETAVLAEFELPPQYCGILEYFTQFTDEYARDRSQIETPGIEWLILADRSPLFPYLSLDRIINPWGEDSLPVAIRLQENTILRFVARGVGSQVASQITRVGGRLLGRFWYSEAYDDAGRRRS